MKNYANNHITKCLGHATLLLSSFLLKLPCPASCPRNQCSCVLEAAEKWASSYRGLSSIYLFGLGQNFDIKLMIWLFLCFV
jgi:hypothetical protein